MCVDVLTRHAEPPGEIFRRVVLHHGAMPHAGTVVPADADMRIVGEIVRGVNPRPFVAHLLQDGQVVLVDIGEMRELVVCGAGESQRPDKIVCRVFRLAAIEPAVIEVDRPHGKLEFQPREPGFLHLLLEPFQGIGRLLHAAQSRDQLRQVVDHEDRLAVDLVVLRVFEILFDVPPAYLFELLAVDLSRPDHILLVYPRQARIPVVEYVVVGPHEVKPHFVHVAGLQEPVVERGLHERPSVVPVPVENKDVHPVAGRLVDLHRHYRRIGFVDIAPQRFAIPVVPRIALLHGHDGLPFPDPHRPERPQARVVRRIGGVDIGRHVVSARGFALLLRSCAARPAGKAEGRGRDAVFYQGFHRTEELVCRWLNLVKFLFRGTACISCRFRRGTGRCGRPSSRHARASVSVCPAARPGPQPACARPATC